MCRCTIGEIIHFFIGKEDYPSPLTERLVKAGYQQISGGYIDKANEQRISVDYRQNTPSQYWHLMSYCQRRDPSKIFPQSIVCGELLFWMAEVSNSVSSMQLNEVLDNIINNPLCIKGDRPYYDRRKWNNVIHKLCFDSICSVVERKHINIPELVIVAAAHEIALGGHVVRVCEYNGEQVYVCTYKEEMVIGLPRFYLWNGVRVKNVNGNEGSELFVELIKTKRWK